MTLLTTAPMAAWLSVATVHLAMAQVEPARRASSELAVAFGVAQTTQVDATASPLQFGGQGYVLAARFGKAAERVSFSAAFDGGERNLAPARAAGSVAEQLTEGHLRIGVRRAIGESLATSSFAVGLDVATSVGVTSHHYDDPSQRVSDFIIGTFTLGPAVDWRRSVGGGEARVQLGVPLVGFVDHPYSDARSAQARVDARFATAATLRGMNAGVTYTTSTTRRVGVEYAYRLRVLRYADLQPVRSVSQSLSVGVITRFGMRGR